MINTTTLAVLAAGNSTGGGGSVKGAPSAAQAAKAALKARQLDYPRNFAFFLVGIIGVCTLVHWTSKALSKLYRPTRRRSTTLTDPEGGNQARRHTSVCRRLVAAALSTIRIIAFRIPVPIGLGRFLLGSEVAFAVVYLVAVWTWTLADTNGLQLSAFRNRAAHMAMVQLPFIIATAGKNNLLSFLTGVSHEKLNVLHRASARCSLILLWVHFFGNWIPGLPAKHDFSHGWMVAGGVGLAAFTLGTVLSLAPIRHRAFEFFLISHIVLMIVYLAGSWFHAVTLEHNGQNWLQWYFWPAVALWALDRALRFARLHWNNTRWRRGSDAGKYARGTVELLSADTLRLTLTRRMAAWTPGQHAYLVLPGVSTLPTEAHPFTIASAPHSLDGTPGPAEKELVFVVRTRDGFTGRLRERAREGKFEVQALVDGPYGTPPDLSGYSTCVLIAGGSGVAYTLAMLLHLVHLANAGKTNVQRIVFVWSVRHAEHLDWISHSLIEALAMAPQGLKIDLRLHVTAAPELAGAARLEHTLALSPSSTTDEKSEAPAEKSRRSSQSAGSPTGPGRGAAHGLRATAGRPDVFGILREAIDTSGGPVSVDVCGPTALAHDVRRALRFELAGGIGVLKGRAPVTMHVETFGM